MSGARHSGLRLQIVLALAGLMLLAFVPLFFAVASLARATVTDLRDASLLALGRAVAAHVSEARASGDPRAVSAALAAHAGGGGLEALCLFGPSGERVACAGDPAAAAAIGPPAAREFERATRGPSGRVVEIGATAGDAVLVARGQADDAGRAAPLVRLVALYMVTFALALIVFAYFALTRLIVRPVEALVASADRVASGARTLRVPRTGARELVELSSSVQAMAERLIAEEATLLLKIEELTETTRKLTQAQAQLVRSERMASVGRLAAGVAHEIGNPIAALMGMEDLLLAGDLDPDTQLDFLTRMRRETDRIHGVLRDLLDFARPEGPADPGGAAPAPADVATVVGDVVALARPQKAFRGVRLEADVAGAPQVTLPGPRLAQVLLNLVLNAGDAIATSGRGQRVTVRVRGEEGGRVRIEVEDDGPGVAEPIRGRLFEPFTTTKDVGAGTGLGLAVCRGLVESAGGEIELDGEYEGGARFVVRLGRA